jgi:hypothetical protein
MEVKGSMFKVRNRSLEPLTLNLAAAMARFAQAAKNGVGRR